MSKRKAGDRKECGKCSESIDNAGFSNFRYVCGTTDFKEGECKMSFCENLTGGKKKWQGNQLCKRVADALRGTEGEIVYNEQGFCLYTDDYVDPKDKKSDTRPVVVEKKNAFYKC